MKKMKSRPKEKEITILLNGGEIYVDKEDPNYYLSELFKFGLDMNLKYWSKSAIKDFYFGCYSLVKDFCLLRQEDLKGSFKTANRRFIKSAGYILKNKKNDILPGIYNLILSSEGLQPLRGFGLGLMVGSKFGNVLPGNPEFMSVMKKKFSEIIVLPKKQKVKQVIKKKGKRKMEKPSYGKLKKAIQALNDSGLLNKKDKIKTVGVKKDDLYENFLTAVESVPEDKEDEIPDVVVEVYEGLTAEEEETPKEEEEDKKEEDNNDEEVDIPEDGEEEEERVKEKKAKKEGGKKKKEEKKEDKSKKEKNLKKESWGGMVKRLIKTTTMTSEAIAKKVTENFPDTREILPKDIKFYMYKLKKSGEIKKNR